jgi:hypothetical protein
MVYIGTIALSGSGPRRPRREPPAIPSLRMTCMKDALGSGELGCACSALSGPVTAKVVRNGQAWDQLRRWSTFQIAPHPCESEIASL